MRIVIILVGLVVSLSLHAMQDSDDKSSGQTETKIFIPMQQLDRKGKKKQSHIIEDNSSDSEGEVQKSFRKKRGKLSKRVSDELDDLDLMAAQPALIDVRSHAVRDGIKSLTIFQHYDESKLEKRLEQEKRDNPTRYGTLQNIIAQRNASGVSRKKRTVSEEEKTEAQAATLVQQMIEEQEQKKAEAARKKFWISFAITCATTAASVASTIIAAILSAECDDDSSGNGGSSGDGSASTDTNMQNARNTTALVAALHTAGRLVARFWKV
jgi:hypothetical protein